MTFDSPPIRFGSDELDAAYRGWGCNCGPAALAACLGFHIEDVRPLFPDFERKGFVNPAMMSDAIAAANFSRRDCASACLPSHGLARVQWGGPWLRPGVPAVAAYRWTHWIATKVWAGAIWIFDVNSGWEVSSMWEQATAPLIVASIKRADGTWSWSHRWEVRRKS